MVRRGVVVDRRDRTGEHNTQPPSAPPNLTQTYDAEIVEVVRETGDIAWNMKIWGDGTRSTNDNQIYGWMMYSVERVYEEPIIINLSCTTGNSADTLTFDTFNNFKMASDVSGEMTVVTAR